MKVDDWPVEQIFGHPDYLKFRSCMTLFSQVRSENNLFDNAIKKFFDGKPDPLTLQALAQD